MAHDRIKSLKLKVWRQENPQLAGRLVEYSLSDVPTHLSFLEMLDLLNETLLSRGERPVEFDSDCREGICGTCGLMVNGQAHGPDCGVAVCQLHMRRFKDGDTILIEPWRARAFPIVRDLVVDRSALDRIIQSGGYVSVSTGGHVDGNAVLIPKDSAEAAMDAAACIGCGACVAACPNGSASLFTGAKVAHLAKLPQGQVERVPRVRRMVARMDLEGFGNCSNIGECSAACPKEISLDVIADLRREYIRSLF